MNEIYTTKGKIKKINFSNFWEICGIPLALIIMVIFFTFISDKFFSWENTLNILRATSIVSICAIGTTILMISGNMDISMASIMGLTGALTIGFMVNNNINPFIAMFLGLLIGCVLGFINALITIYGKIPSFIATLATLSIYRGIALIYTGGGSVYGPEVSDSYKFIGKGQILTVPVPIIIMLILYIIFIIIFKFTKLGLYTYGIGSNERVALLSGVSSNKIKIILFTLGGLTAAIGGIIMTSRLGSAQGGMGDGMEFGIITAAVLGGVSLSGGKGNIARTLLGALLISILNNGMILVNISSFYQRIASGAVLLFALGLDSLKSKTTL